MPAIPIIAAVASAGAAVMGVVQSNKQKKQQEGALRAQEAAARKARQSAAEKNKLAGSREEIGAQVRLGAEDTGTTGTVTSNPTAATGSATGLSNSVGGLQASKRIGL